MAGVEKVSERKIVDAAETLLAAENGELRRVSARKVLEKAGGGNARVNRIVAAWKKENADATRMHLPTDGPEPAIPDQVNRVLEETITKLQELGLSVAHLIDEAVRAERQRCDRDIVIEQDRAKAAIEEMEKDLHAAQVESREYSEDLDRAESDLAAEREANLELADERDKLRVKLAEVERREDRATEEATKQTELRKLTEENKAQIEAQLGANSKAHQNELEALRADYRVIQDGSREKAAELSGAKATIRELRQQLKTADAKPG